MKKHCIHVKFLEKMNEVLTDVPRCAHLTVTGSGTATPGAEFLTSIPAYAAQSDPGVMVSFLLLTPV